MDNTKVVYYGIFKTLRALAVQNQIRTRIFTVFHRYLVFCSFQYPGNPCSSVSPKKKIPIRSSYPTRRAIKTPTGNNKMSTKTAADLAPEDWKHYQPFRPTENVSLSSGSYDEAISVAQSIAEELIHRFGAKKVTLFGSLARSTYNPRSDIDLAVWGLPASKFYRAVAFATGFSKIWKVDLVDAEECGESLRKAILKEGIEL